MKFSKLNNEPARKLVAVIPAASNRMIIETKKGLDGVLSVIENGKVRRYTGGIKTLERLHHDLRDSTPIYEGDIVQVKF